MSGPGSRLDAATAPLSGVNLIEANAGTGKTYSIASLYTRLVLTTDLTVDRILVVSFTEAATAELQERIRARLVSLKQALQRGGSDEPHEAALLEQVATELPVALRRVQRALQSFDEAAIHTIHGFCQRLLAESAFEAGLAFDFELLPDDQALRRQVVDDFWREHTAGGSRLWLEYLYDETNPEKLTRMLGRFFSLPLVQRLVPAPPAAAQVESLETQFSTLMEAIRAAWPDTCAEVRILLGVTATMNQRSYKPAQLDDLFAEADKFCGGQINALTGLTAGKHLHKLGRDTVTRLTKKNRVAPQHRLFDLFQDLIDTARALRAAYESRLGLLQAGLLDFAGPELQRRKRALRVRHFDDLLNDVYDALQGYSSQALAEAARTRYGAALIDEFQDTDPVQYAIFARLFCDGSMPVYFVGDPKQAIYSFRNADVHAYLAARARTDRRYRLDENFRSTPGLVEAVNILFERTGNPFLLEDIGYARSRAHLDTMPLEPARAAPMQWWVVDAVEGERCKVSDARHRVAEVTASEIVRMLNAATHGQPNRPDDKGGRVALQAGDIAVLVRTHQEGDVVRRALADRGVACVQRSDRSVYDTPEAAELTIVLNGITHYNVPAFVRAALATQLLGFDAHALEGLARDDVQWQRQLDVLARLRDIWVRRGFAPMHRELLREFRIEPRLLALADGERTLTNVLHLEDLLQRESAARQRMPDELLAWLQSQCSADAPGNEASLLRLESDEDLVQIQTIHFAKGLQYPVVFCPFLWGSQSARRDAAVIFHDDNTVCLDLGSPEQDSHRALARDEDYAESLRLAYVALTRAQLACIAVWGSVQDVQDSAPAWLLHGLPGDTRASLRTRLKDLPHDQLLAPLREQHGATVTVADLPKATATRFATASPPASSRARVLTRTLPRARRVSSFSALTRSHAGQAHDYDALADRRPGEDTTTLAGIAGFPRGARAGRCIHSLFEHIGFDAAQHDIAEAAMKALAQHGFEAGLEPVLTQMVCDVVRTPLFADRGARLADIDTSRRVDEMEFYFPTGGLAAAELRGALGRFGAGSDIETRLAALDFNVAGGYLHGFIDLVAEVEGRYFLFDYKSNWLGRGVADYTGERLEAEIARRDYYLQYLIYSVALHRHLRRSLESYDYERDFGGVLYLFVRGMQPTAGPGFGVYRARLEDAVMAALERVLCKDVPA